MTVSAPLRAAPDGNRTKRLNVPVSAAEKANIETAARAAGLQPATFLRALGLRFSVRVSADPDRSRVIAALNNIALRLRELHTLAAADGTLPLAKEINQALDDNMHALRRLL